MTPIVFIPEFLCVWFWCGLVMWVAGGLAPPSLSLVPDCPLPAQPRLSLNTSTLRPTRVAYINNGSVPANIFFLSSILKGRVKVLSLSSVKTMKIWDLMFVVFKLLWAELDQNCCWIVEIEKAILVSWIRFEFYRNHDTRSSVHCGGGRVSLSLPRWWKLVWT